MLIALDTHYMSRMNLKFMKIVKFSLVGEKNPTAFLLKKSPCVIGMEFLIYI